MKIKPKVKYKKIKKYLDGKSQQKKLSLLIIRVKGFRTFKNFKNEKKKKHYCFLFDIKWKYRSEEKEKKSQKWMGIENGKKDFKKKIKIYTHILCLYEGEGYFRNS